MTTRIEFIIDVDDDFSSEEISQSETNTLENEHFPILEKIKSNIEATLYELGYDIERSRLSVYEVSGNFLDKKKRDDDVFVITGTPFDLNNPEKPQALNDKDGV